MFNLNYQSSVPIYEQLIKKVKELAALGVLPPNEPMPSVRSLAKDLKINPNTVQKAYQELERDGIIYSVAGKGSFIADGTAAMQSAHGECLESVAEAVTEAKKLGIPLEDVLKTIYHVYGAEVKL